VTIPTGPDVVIGVTSTGGAGCGAAGAARFSHTVTTKSASVSATNARTADFVHLPRFHTFFPTDDSSAVASQIVVAVS
jgi:hypothetical protein